MDEIRGFFTRTKRGGKKDKRKPDRMSPTGISGSRGASPTSLLLRPVPHVKVGSGHDREDHREDTERPEVSQMNPHPDVEVAVQNGPSQEDSYVDGKNTSLPTDSPHPSPSTPSTLRRGEPEGMWRRLIQLLSLIVSPDNTGDSAVPDHFQEALSPDQDEPDVANEKKSNWKSTASAAAKILLRGVSDSADAFGPLKSVAGGLCFILENCEVWPSSLIRNPRCLPVPQRTKANEQAIESLAPRIKAISTLLCTPVSEDDMKERSRRGGLAW